MTVPLKESVYITLILIWWFLREIEVRQCRARSGHFIHLLFILFDKYLTILRQIYQKMKCIILYMYMHAVGRLNAAQKPLSNDTWCSVADPGHLVRGGDFFGGWILGVILPEKWNTSPVYSVIKNRKLSIFAIMNNKNNEKKYFFNP